MRASSAFLSTVLDLAKWDAFIDSPIPLTASSPALMRTPVRLNDGTSADYGFGWYVDSFLGRARIHHDGQYPGFRSDYERFENDRLSVIVLANSGSPRVESLAVKIAGLYAPALATPPFTDQRPRIPAQSVPSGHPVTIHITAKDGGKAAPGQRWSRWRSGMNRASPSISKTSRTKILRLVRRRPTNFPGRPANAGKVHDQRWCVRS